MSVKTLQTIVAIFFLLLGLMGILPNVDEGIFAINNRQLGIETLFGAAELFCGVVLMVSLFTFMRRRTVYRACVIVFILWIIQILLSRFVWGLPHGTVAGFLNWLLVLSVESIVAAAVWLLASTYKK
jgi:hypothetical protein